MAKGLSLMTAEEIVEDFNKYAMYQVLKESKKRYKIKDMQSYDVFTVKKKDWYQNIIRYWVEEILTGNENLTFKEYAKIYTMLNTLEKAVNNA